MLISPKVEFSVTVPFWLKMVARPIPREKRAELFKILAEYLNNTKIFPTFWKVVRIGNTAISDKKGTMLQINVPIHEQISNHAEDLSKGINANLLTIKEIITYYDYGIGVDEIKYSFELIDPKEKDLIALHQNSKKILRQIVRTDLPFMLRNWSSANEAFAEAFQKADCQSSGWLLKDIEKCVGWSENVILYGAHEFLEGHVDFPNDFIADFSSKVSGVTRTYEETVVEFPGIFLSSHGFSGNLAIVDNEDSANHVYGLWGFLAMHWAAFYSANEGIYYRLSQIEPGKDEYNQAILSLRNLKQIRQVLNLIIIEAMPESFCWNTFDEAVYERQWYAWKVKGLLNSLRNGIEYFEATLTDIRNEVSQKAEKRIDRILLIINVLAGVGVTLQALSFWDFDNVIIEKTFRIFVIIGLLIIFSVGTGLYSSRITTRRRISE